MGSIGLTFFAVFRDACIEPCQYTSLQILESNSLLELMLVLYISYWIGSNMVGELHPHHIFFSLIYYASEYPIASLVSFFNNWSLLLVNKFFMMYANAEDNAVTPIAFQSKFKLPAWTDV